MTTILLSLLLAAAAPDSATWYDQYETGVRLVEQGQAAAALPHLEAAYAERQKEGLQIATHSHQYLDYLPHLYMAIAQQMTGNVAKAREQLALAENSGVASKSGVGRPLLIAYELLLRGDTNVRSYAQYSKKSPVLSEEEFNLLRRDVMAKCDVPPDTKQAEAPWYANYELGLELERKGDFPRALSHRALARAPAELGVRAERARDLAASRRGARRFAGELRVPLDAARDRAEADGEVGFRHKVSSRAQRGTWGIGWLEDHASRRPLGSLAHARDDTVTTSRGPYGRAQRTPSASLIGIFRTGAPWHVGLLKRRMRPLLPMREARQTSSWRTDFTH